MVSSKPTESHPGRYVLYQNDVVGKDAQRGGKGKKSRCREEGRSLELYEIFCVWIRTNVGKYNAKLAVTISVQGLEGSSQMFGS